MKTLLALTLVQVLWAPSFCLASDEKKAADPLSACKEKASFAYHFDMMRIEADEIRSKISHGEADARKLARHEEFKEQLEDCE
jgi:hypothetical protein